MRTLAPVLFIALALSAAPAQADWNPGALLDRADLDNVFTSPGDDLVRGIFAQVKGVKNTGFYNTAPSYIFGRIAGGDPGRYLDTWYLLGDRPFTKREYTLMPPFANGVAFHNTGIHYPANGSFVQALLYQPDQVKRSTTSSGSKLLLKQKGSVGFRIGRWRSDFSTSVSTLQAPSCKARANLSTKTTPPYTKVVKFKVRCGNQGSPEQQVRDALEGVFGKKRNGFSLIGTVTKKAKQPL